MPKSNIFKHCLKDGKTDFPEIKSMISDPHSIYNVVKNHGPEFDSMVEDSSITGLSFVNTVKDTIKKEARESPGKDKFLLTIDHMIETINKYKLKETIQKYLWNLRLKTEGEGTIQTKPADSKDYGFKNIADASFFKDEAIRQITNQLGDSFKDSVKDPLQANDCYVVSVDGKKTLSTIRIADSLIRERSYFRDSYVRIAAARQNDDIKAFLPYIEKIAYAEMIEAIDAIVKAAEADHNLTPSELSEIKKFAEAIKQRLKSNQSRKPNLKDDLGTLLKIIEDMGYTKSSERIDQYVKNCSENPHVTPSELAEIKKFAEVMKKRINAGVVESRKTN